MTKDFQDEICAWCGDTLSAFDEIYSDIEENSYCCENCLDSAVAVQEAVRNNLRRRKKS